MHSAVWQHGSEGTHEVVFSSSMCTVQCGSMEAKALSLVLHAVGSEHQQ